VRGSAASPVRRGYEDVFGPSCVIRPSFSRSREAETNSQAQEALVPGDSGRQEAHHACSERLRLQWLKRWVEGELVLMCSRVSYIGTTSPIASALANRGILHPPRVSFLGKEKKKEVLLACYYFPSSFLISICLCFCRVCFKDARMRPCCRRV
jgi:hypothetical protein